LRRICPFIAACILALVAFGLAVSGHAAAPPAREAALSSRYPVLLIPGFTGSELYNGNELVWLDSGRVLRAYLPWTARQAVAPLALQADGETPLHSSVRIRTGDLLRRAGSFDVYGGLIASLENLGYREGRDLMLLPYDWRRDVSGQTAAVDAAVSHLLANNPGAGRVVLIGHSLGGLIARDYVVQKGGAGVRAVIAVGTPWAGTPIAYRTLQYAWGFRLPGTGLAVDLGLSPALREVTVNWGALYQLAPGAAYWDLYRDGYLARGGRSLSHGEVLQQALVPLNGRLARQSSGYQGRLLNGKDYGVDQFLIVGTGFSTVVGIEEKTNWLGFVDRTEQFGNGDEQVPLLSGDLGFSRDPAGPQPYLGKVAAVSYVRADHVALAGAPDTRRLIAQWLRRLN
jgi:pimeloyl-ACP methyl ester carboxylesterase